MFCEDCVYWKYSYDLLAERFGICNSIGVKMGVKKDKESLAEDETLFTGGKFGCIHFRQQHLAVVNFKFLK